MPSLKPETTTPRVEAVIDAMCARFPGASKASQNRYFEAVHQELAPLARELERENRALREQMKSVEQATRTAALKEAEHVCAYVATRQGTLGRILAVQDCVAAIAALSKPEGNHSPINGDQP